MVTRMRADQCQSCGAYRGEAHHATVQIPPLGRLEAWAMDGVSRATDGCTVEPDGTCSHGHESWLLRLGYI